MPAETPDTRTRLIEAARELLWERSFQAAGVDELCARANVRKGSFYHYFPSKTDLAVAAIEENWEEVKSAVFDSILQSDKSGLEQLAAFVKAVDKLQSKEARASGSFAGCPFGNLGQEMARQDERIRTTLDGIFEQHVDVFETMLRRAQAEKTIPEGDVRPKARRIFALFEGALLMAKVANDARVFRQVAPAVVAIAMA